ncbi:hypothetical protein [Streptomyces sp. NPDC002520]
MMWTGRLVKVPFFAEHMREELILYRSDLTGDDRTAVQLLTEPWMTEHSVVQVGRPPLEKERVGLDLGPEGRIEGWLRTPGMDDVVVTAGAEGADIRLAAPEGPATIESDAAVRVLLLWVPPTRPAGTAAPPRTPCFGTDGDVSVVYQGTTLWSADTQR